MSPNRVRVHYYLPDTSPQDFTAYLRILAFLKGEQCQLKATGLSESRVSGEFWDKEEKNWIQDTVRIISIAYEVELSSISFEQNLKEISNFIYTAYAAAKSPQLQIWILVDTIRVYVWQPPDLDAAALLDF